MEGEELELDRVAVAAREPDGSRRDVAPLHLVEMLRDVVAVTVMILLLWDIARMLIVDR